MASLGDRGAGDGDCAKSGCNRVVVAAIVAVFAAACRKLLRSSMASHFRASKFIRQLPQNGETADEWISGNRTSLNHNARIAAAPTGLWLKLHLKGNRGRQGSRNDRISTITLRVTMAS